ncbi:MAG TPA: hypothetical protein VE178_02820 [Silvibacterium sp.]|nr:hypothetical protein [Silvibacterium sp.]
MAMKIGAEDKKKVAIAAVLGVVVLGLVVYNALRFFGGSPAPPPTVVRAPAPTAAPASPATAAPASPADASRGHLFPRRAHEATKIPGSMASLDPTLHPELMAQAESIEYTGKGRNIFSMSSTPVIEEAKAPVRPQPIVPQAPPGPPPPPPIDLKFFGYESYKGGAKKVFLLHGDDVFIAGEGDVVDHHYKVVKIAPLSVQVEDIPYNNTQTLPLIQN